MRKSQGKLTDLQNQTKYTNIQIYKRGNVTCLSQGTHVATYMHIPAPRTHNTTLGYLEIKPEFTHAAELYKTWIAQLVIIPPRAFHNAAPSYNILYFTFLIKLY